MRLRKPEYYENFFIMGGHLADDLCQGALPAVLAFMYQEGRLDSYADVALLVMFTTIVNAVAQPVTGLLADKKPRPWLMWVGMLLAGAGVMFLGLIESFPLMCLLIALNGVGVAAFHPAAGKMANIFAGSRVGRGMSIFSVGGNIGYALGPLYFTAFYMVLGLNATLLLIVPGVLMTGFFIARSRKYAVYARRDHRHRAARQSKEGLKDNYRGTLLLLLLVFGRSAAFASLVTFLPLYFMHVLGEPEEWSTLSVTVLGIAGAIATFCGGGFADRYGFTQWTRFVSVMACPFVLGFIFTDNAMLALLLLVGYSVFYYASMSPIVVIGQKLLPLHVGMATGITVGLGISFGGLTAPLLGSLGDHYRLTATMQAIVALAFLAALMSFLVPVVNRPRRTE